MKLRNLTYLGGLAALALATGTLATHADIDATTDALAVADSTASAYSVSCSTASMLAFTPSIAYILTVTAPTRGTVPTATTHTVSGALSNGVSADSSVASITSATSTSGTNPSKKVMFYHAAPKIKLGGLQCTANIGATMTALGDAADDGNFEVSFQGVSATAYAAGSKVDQVNTLTATTVFGTSGSAGTAAVLDTDDSQGSTYDGEVTFGPGATAVKGGFRMISELTYIGTNPSVTETLSVAMTAS
jgi:hypothetical protein